MNNNLLNLGLEERHLKERDLFNENLIIGRVSTQHRDIYKVITEKEEVSAKVLGKLIYSNNKISEYPAVGDWVLIDRDTNLNGDAIIHKVLERKSYFSRKIAGNKSEEQVVASNIDYVFICMALNNDFNIRRLERYLTVSLNSRAKTVIILTKKDLCENLDEKIAKIKKINNEVKVITTSIFEEEGYNEVLDYVGFGKTIAFIGSSGVGKSTFINRISKKEVLKTNSLSENEKGRHTTTHRELIVLEDRGVIIDTPGMKELGIVSGDLEKSFKDIEDLELRCKFSNCSHKSEPNCAVKEAIESGELEAHRLERYYKLKKEQKVNEDKQRKLEIKRKTTSKKSRYNK